MLKSQSDCCNLIHTSFDSQSECLILFSTDYQRQNGNGFLPSPISGATLPNDLDEVGNTGGGDDDCNRVPEMENGRMMCDVLPGGGKKCTPGETLPTYLGRPQIVCKSGFHV